MKKIKVVQFLPYFPPHKWGLETVAEEFSKYFVSEWCWEVLNVTFSVGQESLQSYEKDGYKVLILPAFDIVPNYPFPKFWTKQFWTVLKETKKRNPNIIQTHTRFFLSTFLGGICAKIWKKKWVHVEHGSGFVKWLVRRKSFFANLYDHTFGRLCFNASDQIVAISKGNISFIRKFSKTPVEVIYRGLDFPEIRGKEKKSDIISIGFIGRLVKLKGVDILIAAFSELLKKNQKVNLEIVGDWEEMETLRNQVKNLWLEKHVNFWGYQEREKVQSQILPSFDIFVNPSLQEGLPTTVIEALLAECIVVATDVGWTKEITNKWDFFLIKPWSVDALRNWLEQALNVVWKENGASYQNVKEKFDWKIWVKQYLDVYNKT